jgi:Ca2+-transporting ATPase
MTEAIITAIALAVSVIPEGLLATMTIIMAIGVQKMTKRNAIVKKLDTIQTLGSVSIICTDKTGTLTQNKMSVVKIANYDDINARHIINVDNFDVNKYQEIINCGILCNNATIDATDKEIIHGDPTEGALLNLGVANKLDNTNIIATNKRLAELPFDSVRKMMSTINDVNGKTICYTKGAVELLIKKCKYVYSNGGVIPITDEIINQIDGCVTDLSSQAFRVLGFASREVERNNNYKNAENELIFLGLVCMIDPPRLEVIDSIKTCASAGIKTVMITGDHVLTAKAIGKQIGLFKEHHTAIDGVQLAQMSDEELDKQVQNVTVFARVSPSDKLRIVNSFQKQAEIVAMTGDGVNDAPALKSANIGIAMGKSGTDVAKQSANMLLLDDSFTTIGKAVFEGRKIYNNLKKVIEFLLTGNVCEVLVMLILIVSGCITPLTGVQILIMNLITETVPSLALGVEPAEYDIMLTPPLKNNRIFTKAVLSRFIYHCLLITGLSLGAYFIGLHIGGTVVDNGTTTAPTANVMVFLTMALAQVFHTMNLKSVSLSLFSKHNKNNKVLLIANASIIVFIVALVFIPGLNAGLNTDGLYYAPSAN